MKNRRNKKTYPAFLNHKEYSKIKQANDSSLIKLIRKNPLAYGELIRRYERKLFSYLYRLVRNKEEVEDLLQNVFVKVYNNIEKFDTKRKFSSWIYRIAHNEAVNFLKKKGKRRLVSWEDVTSSKDKLETKSEERSPFDEWILNERRKEVQSALKLIPEKYQEVLALRYFYGKSYAEIGKALKKPVNTVGTLINRAKKKLMKKVKEGRK